MWRSVLENRDGCADSPTDSESSAVFEGHKYDVYSVTLLRVPGMLWTENALPNMPRRFR
jgi:hypothetical protein